MFIIKSGYLSLWTMPSRSVIIIRYILICSSHSSAILISKIKSQIRHDFAQKGNGSRQSRRHIHASNSQAKKETIEMISSLERILLHDLFMNGRVNSSCIESNYGMNVAYRLVKRGLIQDYHQRKHNKHYYLLTEKGEALQSLVIAKGLDEVVKKNEVCH